MNIVYPNDIYRLPARTSGKRPCAKPANEFRTLFSEGMVVEHRMIELWLDLTIDDPRKRCEQLAWFLAYGPPMRVINPLYRHLGQPFAMAPKCSDDIRHAVYMFLPLLNHQRLVEAAIQILKEV